MKKDIHVFLRLFAKIFAEQISKTTFSARLGLAMSLSLAATTAAFAKTIDLSTVEPTFDNVIQVGDGDVLTGTLDGSERAYKVVIAAGATVTLENATIKGYEGRNHENSWAGINCEGKCNIYLAEGSENSVTGFDVFPAIYVSHESTLTIDGNGQLKVETDGVGAGIGGSSITGSMAHCGNIVINGGSIHAKSYFGAGIGSGGSNADCDGITINGGTIVVESGYGAGIGSGRESNCGNIVINGGSVTASVQYIGAGIGCGYNGSCGDITISANVTKISVTKGTQAFSYSIGVNGRGSVGKITIGGVETGNISKSPYVYPSDAYTVVFSKNDGSEDVQKQTIFYNSEQTLTPNSFVRDGLWFVGWNTKADGSGVAYFDGAKVLNIANAGETLTLYAQWINGDISNLNMDYIVQDGTVLTGTLVGKYKITIAQNATVTLNNVTINGEDKEEYKWSGISCFGNCTIVLADGSTNIVRGFNSSYPGIEASYNGTLTIQGNDGKLYASSNGNAAGIGTPVDTNICNIVILGGDIVATGGDYAPGIGNSYSSNLANPFFCGDIQIKGGTITAIGGKNAVGIGSGVDATIHDIEISGGIVYATGGDGAPAIGGSVKGNFRNITISGSDTKVTAIKGEDAPYSIGEGLDGSRTGDIAIGDGVTAGIVGSPFKYPVVQYTVTFDANGGTGTMSNQSTNIDPELILEANGFTREGYSFVGWNTKANGSGDFYANQEHVNFAEVGESITLYAQWKRDAVNLAALTDNYTAKDGDVLTGTLDGSTHHYKVSVAAGATITLENVTIDAVQDFAALACEGDCNILLAEGSVNDLKGHRLGPGIYIPNGATLTIDGNGELKAQADAYAAGIGSSIEKPMQNGGSIVINGGKITATSGYGGGIGSGAGGTGYVSTCENIVINGGEITATSQYGAGIGSGNGGGGSSINAKCGDITITGGSIHATSFFAAIGSSLSGEVGNILISGGTIDAAGHKYGYEVYVVGGNYCGDITIGENVAQITVTTETVDGTTHFCIGGKSEKVGIITIGGVVTGRIISSQFQYPQRQYTVVFDKNEGSGEMESQTVYYNTNQPLPLNTYTREGYVFAGWNTQPDGSGDAFADGEDVLNLANSGESVTLYAQWFNGDVSVLKIDFVIENGTVLTGRLGRNVKITIAADAEVTLDGLTIEGEDNEDFKWAGLTCLRSCTINLADGSTNVIKGFYASYPGIFISKLNTLTIKGNGSLEVSSNGKGAGIGAAISGNGFMGDGGNIVIKGGNITATGGENAAGIGAANGFPCGDIVIDGGDITATGGENAAGIGGDYKGQSGDITIDGGNITATGGKYAAGIGGASYGQSGNIVIKGGYINATGGVYSAGIGSAYHGQSGDIVIEGGDITAMGHTFAAGIGGAYYGSIGNITISGEKTKIYAMGGVFDIDTYYSVGKGLYGSRTGTITIGGVEVPDVKTSPFVYPYVVFVYDDDKGQKHVVINGEYSGDERMNIEEKIDVNSVMFGRTFTKDVYSTMVLPFSVKTEKVSGLNAVLYYNGIGKDPKGYDAIRMKVLWAADGVIKDDEGNLVHYKDTVMNANTPYLVLMGSETFEVEGPVTIVPTTEAVTKYDNLEWEFRGMWEYKVWGAQGVDKEVGYAYGFAASSPKDSKIKVGDFVKIGEGTHINPLRAYLVSSNIPETTTPTQGIRANGAYAKRPTVTQKKLPELMSVIVDDEGDGKQTTVIGQFNTRTGEFKMNNAATKRTFDVKGRNVGNKANKARGAYYGKKTTARHPER